MSGMIVLLGDLLLRLGEVRSRRTILPGCIPRIQHSEVVRRARTCDSPQRRSGTMREVMRSLGYLLQMNLASSSVLEASPVDSGEGEASAIFTSFLRCEGEKVRLVSFLSSARVTMTCGKSTYMGLIRSAGPAPEATRPRSTAMMVSVGTTCSRKTSPEVRSRLGFGWAWCSKMSA